MQDDLISLDKKTHAVAEDGHVSELVAIEPHLLLAVGELGVVLVILLALRAVDRRVQRSFHGCEDGNSIANPLDIPSLGNGLMSSSHTPSFALQRQLKCESKMVGITIPIYNRDVPIPSIGTSLEEIPYWYRVDVLLGKPRVRHKAP